MMTAKSTEHREAVSAELRRVRATYPQAAHDPALTHAALRLATLRVMFRELNSSIRAGETATSEAVAESHALFLECERHEKHIEQMIAGRMPI